MGRKLVETNNEQIFAKESYIKCQASAKHTIAVDIEEGEIISHHVLTIQSSSKQNFSANSLSTTCGEERATSTNHDEENAFQVHIDSWKFQRIENKDCTSGMESQIEALEEDSAFEL